MEIRINGKSASIASKLTLLEWLESQQLTHKRIAIEVNGAIVPKSKFSTTFIQEYDEIEVIRAVGGG